MDYENEENTSRGDLEMIWLQNIKHTCYKCIISEAKAEVHYKHNI